MGRTCAVTAAGITLGISGNLLLRTTPWGINLTIWTLIFIVLAFLLAGSLQIEFSRESACLAVPVAFFAAAFALRDSNTLKFLNGMGIAATAALAAMRGRRGSLGIGGTLEYTVGFLAEWLKGPQSFIDDIRGELRNLPHREGGGKKAAAVARGLAFAAPVLLVFGKLLTDADAAFDSFVSGLLDWNIPEAAATLLWILVFAVAGGGMMHRLLVAEDFPERGPERRLSLGIIEVAMIAGAVDILFCAFLAVQLGYFFGGNGFVAGTPGLTLASYARSGFFELVAVAALVLPLLLLLDWLLVPVKWLDVRIFRNLSRAMVGMLFVMMASALHRMYLYQESFGLTELRLYTTAFMFWLALLFAWFLKTVSTGRRERFAFGGVILALVVALSLDLLNPDAVIVRINTAKGAAGNIDLRYLVSLSDDAVPALVDSLVGLNEYSRRYVVEQLTAADRKADWRSWNLGSHLAGAAVRDRIVPIARQPGTAPAGNP